jgi:hypothetical protein
VKTCPKCGAADEVAEARGACARCGLRVDLWATFDPTPAPHPAIDAAFAELCARWEEPAAHDAFLREANMLGALDAAAARYRQVLRERKASADLGDDLQARRALAQVATFATELERAAPRDYLRRWRAAYYIAVAGAVVLCALSAVFVWHVFRSQP